MQATFCLKVGQTVQAEIPPSALDALPWRFTQPQAPLQLLLGQIPAYKSS